MGKIVEKNADLEHGLTRQVVSFRHQMSQIGLFDDGPLADLIDIARAEGPAFYTLGSLDENGFGEKWQTGVLGDMSGAD
ncbi:MAG TPA: hypothetical protein ENJ55_01320, partial [Rhizobiales bacterium]|nr:hypothetical protein [Hyphomicrobiales bacterium]